tara:strand:- start:4292 stop:5332 length:1041 start_codon:yes stop_codon:yes gene_type:complete
VFVYWAFYLFISFLSINIIYIEKNLNNIFKLLFILSLSVFIGLRHEVGGDWDIYNYDYYNNLLYFNFYPLEYVRDFGYELLSYLTNFLQSGIYSLNFILAFFFVLSLHKLSMTFNNNYMLVYIIAFPYLITVVAMGFTRQASALAFFLFSICALKNEKFLIYFIYSCLALIFHKSSAILIPLVFLSYFRFSFSFIFIFLLLLSSSLLIIFPEINRVYAGYINKDTIYISKGVYFRIALNILAGILFIIFYKKIKIQKNIDKLIILTFVFNIILLYFINDYSVLVDRFIIYFAFIQLIVFSRLYLIYPDFKVLFNIAIILLYSLIYFIWFEYSIHSYAWMPYKNILF